MLSAHQRMALSRAGFEVEQFTPHLTIVKRDGWIAGYSWGGWGSVVGESKVGDLEYVLEALRAADIDPNRLGC